MKTIIELRHNPCDYTCMWNGIEDLYTRETGEIVPGFMFFTLSGMGNSIYMKFKNENLPRFAAFGDGRPLKMYPKVNSLIGFEYRFSDGGSFENLLVKARAQIDAGKPVVLGPLDMYYLPYLRMYRKYHIPCHYVLMAGYDDEASTAYLYDCGRNEIQSICYDELKAALAVEKTELGDKNGILTVDFTGKTPGLFQIAREGFMRKAADILDSKAGFVGIKAIRKLAREITSWESKLTEVGCRNSLTRMVEYMGNVPKIPNALLGIPGPDEISYAACRNSMSRLFSELYERYDYALWKEAANLFCHSGTLFEELAEKIICYLTGSKAGLEGADDLLNEIAGLEEAAWNKCREE